MTKAQGHSLWISPRGIAGDVLSAIIQNLSAMYKTPYFPPHVTLLARIIRPQSEVVALMRELSSRCNSFSVELTKPAFTRDYFRSLFLEAAPSSELLAAHRLAQALFDLPDASYSPHLSLLYGDLPEAEKNEIISSLGRGFPTRFTAEAIDVYATEGVPKNWRLVESVQLS
jgi:hypothetical protein